jgi:hypothetical protein
LIEKSHVEAEISHLQARIDQAKIEQHQLLAERDELAQADYLDRAARKLFDFARPGDTVLVMVKEPAPAPESAGASAIMAEASVVDLQKLPVWQQWISFFTSDSFALLIP